MISLLYHDVVPEGDFAASGFGGWGASRYKFTTPEFERHLDALAGIGSRPLGAVDARGIRESKGVFLTFDDGGASAWERTAGMLESRGWRGTFFVTTDYIGTPKFLSASQIRDLGKRGHAIGTHSCSHPPLMARRKHEELVREWSESKAKLSDILGETVELASVPGGFYGKNVAAAAAECGIRALFTSEPVSSLTEVDGCVVSGRYTIQRGLSPRNAARMAGGSRSLRWLQYLQWQSTKTLQRIGGIQYHRLRRAWLEGPHRD